MTRTTNARIAGFTFLAYIAAGITSMVLFRRAAPGEESQRSSRGSPRTRQMPASWYYSAWYSASRPWCWA